jgi:hypothetical protein
LKNSILLSVEPEIKPLGLSGDFVKNANLISELGFDGVELLVVNLERIDTKRI